jgi:ribosomal protein S18 acetylase RimI-like enzyme
MKAENPEVIEDQRRNGEPELGNTHIVEVRLLEAADWSTWRAVRLKALAEAPWAFGSKLEDWQGDGDTEARWRARFAEVPYNAVAFMNNEAVGQVGAMVYDSATTLLISMWVSPASRGKAVGAALINAVVLWSSQHGNNTVRLNVKSDNQRAIDLYERQGFVIRRDVASEDPTEIVMSRNVSTA